MRLVAGVMLVCALAACKKDNTAEQAGPAATQEAAQAVAPPPVAVSAEVAAMGAEQLREAASAALREQRLYAPAGNNAMEYYLALRDKSPNDPAVASALTDLMPYTLIATEQSINRDDFSEAQRLYALMEKTNPQAPALPRLKQSIADAQASLAQRTADAAAKTEEDAKKQADLEKQRLADQQKLQQQAAQQLAAQQAADAKAAADKAAADKAAADKAAADKAAADRAAAQRTAQQQSAPAQASSNDLRPISTPSPRYPPEAYRDGTAGEVQVEFTVGTDGSVTSARVVRADPPRVFDREALNAVKRWKFQPVSSPVTSRRTIGFNPGG
ncbi:energy transducer TonB [Pseudoluteimonas lycopersici]|uniref:Protein TonB n=2 Tax=Pseudoluteimonas lycopersici TaxID=1324796 RepID=A0A516V8F8_9GAMM|nr:energy transducer TonB [Lysobacter lycopersici]